MKVKWTPRRTIDGGVVDDAEVMVRSLTETLVKALSMVQELVAKPLVRKLAKALLNEAEVVGKAPHQKVSEGIAE